VGHNQTVNMAVANELLENLGSAKYLGMTASDQNVIFMPILRANIIGEMLSVIQFLITILIYPEDLRI
jgi:hypothetical protein